MKIPFKITRENMVVILVKVGDKKKPMHVMVDTGCQSTAISLDAAPKGFTTHTHPEVSNGVGGTEMSIAVTMPFNVAGVPLNYFSVLNPIFWVRLSKASKLEIHGIVGNDFLRQFSNVTFDFKNNILTLEGKSNIKPPKPEKAHGMTTAAKHKAKSALNHLLKALKEIESIEKARV